MRVQPKLMNPWLVAVWPGMGNVALSAGYYLMSKLGMHGLAEYCPSELFDVDHVEVERGLVRTGRRPRSRLFAWTDPHHQHDLVVFIGESQPPMGRYTFCQKLIEYARELGVERVFTFAAMATRMHPDHSSRVFGAAADPESLEELRRLKLELLQDGHIVGLNGILLGVAAESGLRGACLLGEIPHILSQLPFPKASLAVLKVFRAIAGLDLDVSELTEQVAAMDEKLGEILGKVESVFEEQIRGNEEGFSPEPVDEGKISPADERRIEELFDEAEKDRSRAYELKRELDRLEVFKDYEDRFLDLFKKAD